MKKQKNPITLILLLAILFGGVAFMNKPVSNGPDKPTPEVKPEDKEQVGESVASEMKAKVEKQKEATKHAVRPPGRPGPGGDGPSILKPQIVPQKPKPSDSSTSTQWYTKESARNLPQK